MQLLVILQEQSCPKGYAVSTSAVQNAKKRCVTTKRSLCASSTDLVTPQGRVSSSPFTPSICLKYSLSVFSQTFHFFFLHLFSPHFLYLPDVFSHARYFLNFFLFIPSSLISSRFISVSSVSFHFISSHFILFAISPPSALLSQF